MAKLVLDYSNTGDVVFGNKTRGMATGLKDNPHFALPWPTEFPTLAAFTAKQLEFADALNAAADRDKAKVATKNARRAELQVMVREIGRYLQTKSGGDRAILETTGYDLAKDPVASPDVPGAPQNFKVVGGSVPGSALCSADAPDGSLAFEIQYCVGDTSVPANWKVGAQSGKCKKVEVTGLERGKDHTFRIRAIGKKGPGPWSDVAVYMPN